MERAAGGLLLPRRRRSRIGPEGPRLAAEQARPPGRFRGGLGDETTARTLRGFEERAAAAVRRLAGRSLRGLYGDVVEEIDAGVGRILDTLCELKLERRTLVVFSSDNGPWLAFDEHGSSAGLLREGKGSTWEGGMREPALFWWPGRIKPGVVTDLGSLLDVFPTCVALAGGKLPADRVLDGADLSPALLGTGPSPRRAMFFYRDTKLYAVRHGPWKAHFITQSGYGPDKPVEHDPPLLFHLGEDPGERFNAGVKPVPSQLEAVIGKD